MKRIGIVLPNVPRYSETFFVNKIQGLCSEGYIVTLFANDKMYNNVYKVVAPFSVAHCRLWQTLKTCCVLLYVWVRCPGITFRFLSLERKDGISWFNRLRTLYINAHILPCHLDWIHFGYATMGVGRENVAKAMGAKAAVSFRGYDVSTYPLTHQGCYKRLWTKINQIHTISEALLDEAYLLGLPKEVPVVKITPAIDWKRFSADIIVPLSLSPIRIVTVGRLEWKKGYEYALQTMALLKQQGVSFTYTIMGDGADKERLVFAAYQWGISDRVNFLGSQPQEKVAAVLRESALYIQPSVQEGFCNAVLEAQAMGLLCVVTDAEGLSENVINGKSGFVVPKRSPQAMADIIVEITQMTDEARQQIRTFAVERVRKEFNLEDQQRKWAAFYEV